jgi:FAD/FMN-containing dehydrogenase
MADKAVAADVVTADGTQPRCDANAHEDLLRALRGGGGGYALVTHLELRLDRIPELFGGQALGRAPITGSSLGAGEEPRLRSDGYCF